MQWWKNFLSCFIYPHYFLNLPYILGGIQRFKLIHFTANTFSTFISFTKLKDHLVYLLARYIFHLANALHHQDLCHKIYCARDTFDTLGFFCEKRDRSIIYQNKYSWKFHACYEQHKKLFLLLKHEAISQLPSKLVKSYRSSSTP